MSKRGFGGQLWCVVGSFNAVKYSSERRGSAGIILQPKVVVFKNSLLIVN